MVLDLTASSLPLYHSNNDHILAQKGAQAMKRPVRPIAAAVCIAVLGWLIWERTIGNNPWRDPRFVRKVTVALSDHDQKALEEELQRVAGAAGARSRLRLNAPFKSRALNIYITKSAASDQTGCRPGDARYDARQDVLLVDEGVVWPLAASVGYGSIHVSPTEAHRTQSPKMWLHFALLHELGHRALHGGFLLRSLRAAHSLEDEADAFAFPALERLATEDEYESDTGFAVLRIASELDETDRSAAEVASLVQQLSVTLLFGGSQFSPFHSDTAHAAFVARFRPRLLDALARARSQAGRSYVLLALAYLDRVEETGNRVTAEIYSADPLLEARLESGSLIVTAAPRATRSARVYRLPITRLARSTEGAVRLLLPNKEFPGTTPAEGPPSSPRPAREGVLLTNGRQGPEWRVLDARGRVLTARTDEALRAELRTRFLLTSGQAANCTIAMAHRTPYIDVSFTCYDDLVFPGEARSLFFVGELDPKNLTIKSLEGLYGPPKAPGDVQSEAQTLVDLRVDGRRETYIVTDTLADRHIRRFELRVTRLQPPFGPVVASRALAADWIPTGGRLDNWLRVSHPPVIGCQDAGDGLATCTEFLDSVFLFDARTKTLSTLFYPAGAYMTRGASGLNAFYVQGGHKVFVVQSRRGEVSTAQHPNEAN